MNTLTGAFYAKLLAFFLPPVILAPASGLLGQSRLLQPLPQSLEPLLNERIERLSARPDARRTGPVKVDAKRLISGASTLQLELFSGVNLTMEKQYEYLQRNGDYVWEGEVTGNAMAGYGIFVVTGNRVTASVKYGNKSYAIRTLDDSFQLMVEIDSSRGGGSMASHFMGSFRSESGHRF